MAAPPEAPSARGRAEGDRLALPGHDLRQVAQWRSGDELARGPAVRLESCQSRLLLWRNRAGVRKVLPLADLAVRLRVMSRRALALATALVLATALDVMVAAGSGYNLRMEPLRLVAVDAALLALLVVPTLGAVHATRRIPGFPGLTALVPRASVLFAAWAPILAMRVGRVSSASELAPHLIVTAILALVVFLETRRGPGAPRRAEALVA